MIDICSIIWQWQGTNEGITRRLKRLKRKSRNHLKEVNRGFRTLMILKMTLLTLWMKKNQKLKIRFWIEKGKTFESQLISTLRNLCLEYKKVSFIKKKLNVLDAKETERLMAPLQINAILAKGLGRNETLCLTESLIATLVRDMAQFLSKCVLFAQEKGLF